MVPRVTGAYRGRQPDCAQETEKAIEGEGKEADEDGHRVEQTREVNVEQGRERTIKST